MMSQQVPPENNVAENSAAVDTAAVESAAPQGDPSPRQYEGAEYEGAGYENTAPNGGYVDAAPGGYHTPHELPMPGTGHYAYEGAVHEGTGGGYWQLPQGQQAYARNRVPMIDPIESAKLTPQIMFLLVLSGLRRHWKWSMPMALALGLLATGVLYLLFPLQYMARATIHMHASRPQLIAPDPGFAGGTAYDQFVNTQIAFMRSPDVISKALEDPEIARLPIINKQRDKRDWVAKKLTIRREGRSEIIGISIETDDRDASEKIVNAVVDAYIVYIENQASTIDMHKQNHLQIEKRLHQTHAATLQRSITDLTERAARLGASSGEVGFAPGLGQGESLLRDLRVAQTQLVVLQARRRAIQQRLNEPTKLPSEVIRLMSPEFTTLNRDREEALARLTELERTLLNPNDPRLQMARRELDRLDERIMGFGNIDDAGMAPLIHGIILQDQMTLWSVEEDIRMQEIMVQDFITKYNEQLAQSVDRSTMTQQIEFDRRQLSRLDSILDQIEDRLVQIQSDRRAPDQISLHSRANASTPNRIRQFGIVGMGAAAFAFLPLFLSIVIERFKPRLYHVSQVRRAVPQVLIGEIMEPPVSWLQGKTFRKRLARYRESVHNWCTHLLLSDPFRSCRTISVASVAGDDGKTFLAVQIALAMAQMKNVSQEGPVLLIDGDMRVGRLHLLFGNEEPGIGLADVLDGRAKLGLACVQNENEPGMDLLTAGQLASTPYEILGDGRFRELLDVLEQKYSLIIVVLPPVANASEALFMASCTDSTLLCVRQRETVLAAMEDVYRKLVNTGAAVDGIVVKDIPYYQMASRDGGFADKLEQIRLSHLLQYAD